MRSVSGPVELTCFGVPVVRLPLDLPLSEGAWIWPDEGVSPTPVPEGSILAFFPVGGMEPARAAIVQAGLLAREAPTLLIDLDFEGAGLHWLLGLEEGDGLSDILLYEVSLDRAVRSTSIPGLSVIRRGSPVLDLERLVRSPLWNWLQEKLSGWSYVLLAFPRPLPTALTPLLQRFSQGILYVGEGELPEVVPASGLRVVALAVGQRTAPTAMDRPDQGALPGEERLKNGRSSRRWPWVVGPALGALAAGVIGLITWPGVGPEPLGWAEPSESVSLPTDNLPAERLERAVEEETGFLSAPRVELRARPYSVQIGAFRTVARATAGMAEWGERGETVYRVPVPLGGQGVWQRVFVGAFETEGEARAALDRFEAAGWVSGGEVRRTPYAFFLEEFETAREAWDRWEALTRSGVPVYVVAVSPEGPYRLYAGAFEREVQTRVVGELLVVREILAALVERRG